MSKELPKSYNGGDYENEIYKKWEELGCFNPDNLDLPETADKYSNILPPPNANGELHIGHASGYVVMDLFGRYNRMQQKRTLLLPGKDHAGIQTQVVYEKKIKKEQGKNRHDIGREQFYKDCYDFCTDRAEYMRNQEKKLGLSADWSREKFTLDPSVINIALETFVKMYNEVDEDGKRMVYRGERIINWCPRCASALADVEVEHEEQKAMLYTFKYDKNFPIAISTTRPETKLGDTAVAVNPDDERYKQYVGKIFQANFCGIDLEIKVIADKEVDMAFGTGALGVTPAHSAVDWQMAQNNDLKIIKVIDEEAKIKQGFGEFSGMDVSEARQLIAQKIKENGLMETEEEIDNSLSVCERCKTAIEPLVSLQWFVNVDHKNFSLKKEARKVVENDEIKIYPENFKKIMLNWIDNVHDWCISRQIWWGPRIPVWYRSTVNNSQLTVNNEDLKVWDFKIYGEDIFNNIKNNRKRVETRIGRERSDTEKNWDELREGDVIKFSLVEGEDERVVETGLEKIIKKVHHFTSVDEMLEAIDIKDISPDCGKEEYKKWAEENFADRLKEHGVWAFELDNIESKEEIYVVLEKPEGDGWVQDEDTFDTWFSSGQWAYTTLGYPEGDDYNNFYPSDTMVMGRDILPFWAFRMIILSLYRTGKIPFKNLYFTGLIRDEHGQKMSKSKGNGIEPLEMIEKYGTDAVRLSLSIGSSPGIDMNLGETKIAGYRNFVNKLWNISRYIISNFSNGQRSAEKISDHELTDADAAILYKMKKLIQEVTSDLDDYKFSQAGEKLKEFTWEDLADWYLETSKFEKNKNKELILNKILRDLLKLWHPFIPFVTEAIWKNFNETDLIIEKWPSVEEYAGLELKHSRYKMIKNIIIAIRNARAENKVEPSRKVKVKMFSQKNIDLIKNNIDLIKGMRTGVEEIEIKEESEKQDNAIHVSVGEIEIYLIGAVDEEKEKARIAKEVENLKKLIEISEKKLSNKAFTDKAPAEVVNREKENLKQRQAELSNLLK